jgi:hypothetical protein
MNQKENGDAYYRSNDQYDPGKYIGGCVERFALEY